MKSLTSLWNVLADEIAGECDVSTKRDQETVSLRVKDEGLSFLTITLPSFCDDLQKGLAAGKVSHDLFPFFRKRGRTPRFLGDLLDLVFDRWSGRLLDEPHIGALRGIRQLTLLYSKVGLQCSDARVAKAYAKFIECEKEVKRYDAQRSKEDLVLFQRSSALLFADILSAVDTAVYSGDLVGKHGPGATADRLRGNAKYDPTWTSRLESIFPYGENVLPNWRYHASLDSVHFLEPSEEIPVRVITVPKTLKSPRIIAIEPTCMQFMQQAILEVLVPSIESSKVSKMIGFTDQQPNQLMAQFGSSSGELASLDLSEASDRVSNQLVRAMLHRHPYLAEAVDATRSRRADVPGYGVRRLAKFASMGSALCFPFEAMTFLSIIFIGISRSLNRPLGPDLIREFRDTVRVYGDDIIVPVAHTNHVIEALSDFGLKVNLDKSFWTGAFRESCGKEYYNGHDVSVVKVRSVLPTSRDDASAVLSLSSTRNQFYWSGLWKTAYYLDEKLLSVLDGIYPYVASTSAGVGRESCLGFDKPMWDPSLHRPLVKAYVSVSQPPLSPIGELGALFKCLTKRGSDPLDERHLTHFGRPDRVRIKVRKVQPY